MCLFFIPYLVRKFRNKDNDEEEQPQHNAAQPPRPVPAYGDKMGQQPPYAANEPAPQYQQHLGGQYGQPQYGGQPPLRQG